MTETTQSTYTLGGTTTLDFEHAVAMVRETLAKEGFGVLTEIDVQATLREKLGAALAPYVILGACSPPYAHQALAVEPDLGALLPCNVAVYVRDGETMVSAIDPARMLSIVGNPALEPVAAEIKERLGRAVAKVVAA